MENQNSFGEHCDNEFQVHAWPNDKSIHDLDPFCVHTVLDVAGRSLALEFWVIIKQRVVW